MRGRHQTVARSGGQHLRDQLLALKVYTRRQSTEVVGGDLRPNRPVELVAGVAQQDQGFTRLGAEPRRDTALDIIDDAEHTDDRSGQDRGGARLVIEADVAAGDRNAKRRTAVGEATDGLAELPHDTWVLG